MSLIEDFMLKNKVLANTIWAVYVGSNLLETQSGRCDCSARFVMDCSGNFGVVLVRMRLGLYLIVVAGCHDEERLTA